MRIKRYQCGLCGRPDTRLDGRGNRGLAIRLRNMDHPPGTEEAMHCPPQNTAVHYRCALSELYGKVRRMSYRATVRLS